MSKSVTLANFGVESRVETVVLPLLFEVLFISDFEMSLHLVLAWQEDFCCSSRQVGASGQVGLVSGQVGVSGQAGVPEQAGLSKQVAVSGMLSKDPELRLLDTEDSRAPRLFLNIVIAVTHIKPVFSIM